MQVLLIAVLIAATLALAGLAWVQRRRRWILARIADECGMRFAAHDPFDVARRYGQCELMQAGHSAYAENVIYGHVGHWLLRAFDCHVEAGHGPHRLTRRLSVVAADVDFPCAPALVWRGGQAHGLSVLPVAPLSLADGWQGCGEPAQVQRLIRSWAAGGPQTVCIQACGTTLLFWADRRLGPPALVRQLRAAAGCLDVVDAQAARKH